MKEVPLYLDEKQLQWLLVLLNESPTVLERMKLLGVPLTEEELHVVAEKARTASWSFIHNKRS